MSSPGLVKVHEGSTASLVWETDEEIVSASAFHTSVNVDHQIVAWIFGQAYFTTAYKYRAYSLEQGTAYGFALNTTLDSDALNYIFSDGNGAIRHNATIYIYSEFACCSLPSLITMLQLKCCCYFC